MPETRKIRPVPVVGDRRRTRWNAEAVRCRAAWRKVALSALLGTVVLGAAVPCAAHEGEILSHVVVDTDLGVDDVVALSMILQSPELEVVAVVAGEGVADAATAGEQLARLVNELNRPDVRVHVAPQAEAANTPPPFRLRAAAAVDRALTSMAAVDVRPMAPEAYEVGDEDEEPVTVLALGPLTRLAGALAAEPELASSIERIVVSGDPDAADDWNLAFDREAVDTVRAAGIQLVFVRPGDTGLKPEGWYTNRLMGGQRTSLGEALLDRLLADPVFAAHYLKGLEHFHDELAALYVLRPELFAEVGDGIVEPADGAATVAAVTDELGRGRQRKDRVVFIDGSLPAEILRDDVRLQRDAIIEANGPDEWFAQLLLNELHEHLGAYSIIGVKMGLRAAELLNAPPHAMTVVSSAPPAPPVSCLNDGLLVATGSTPGRGLFTHVPGPPGTVKAVFEYNGRTVELRLKDEYRARIRSHIQSLLADYTLEDDEYWDGVRELGLEIWQDWHRRDLFEVEVHESPGTEVEAGHRP